MKGGYRLTKAEQFDSVYNTGKSAADRLLVLKGMANGLEVSRFGISVGKRVGNAVVRNRVKRRLREIIRLSPLQSGWDFIVIARATTASSGHQQLENSVHTLLSRLKMAK
jgi:ribonuclease P protein component